MGFVLKPWSFLLVTLAGWINRQQLEVIEYLKDTPSAAELKSVLKKLGISARDLLRKKEAEYKEAGLDDESLSDDAIINAMIEYPKLIERPIVINGEKARIGRPPEQVLEIV